MARHHTKDKGDLGVAKAFADLVGQGYLVLFPSTEHAPFDLVAYRDGRFLRVQVKFRSAHNGCISMQFTSWWADRHGVHQLPMDKASVDLVCIYCPDTDECYYLRPTDFTRSVTLRLTPTRNRQRLGVRYASEFRRIPDLTQVEVALIDLPQGAATPSRG